MATKAHKLLTGTDLHEPKGVAAAPSGQVYVSDGAGSGVWTTISIDIGFSTGDIKSTYKIVADTGWLMLDDTTIGSVASTATHKSATYQSLFLLLWNNINSAYTTVSGGRGGSAAADWAANKSITLPKALGRAMGVAGAGASLTTRNLGQTGIGAETYTLGTLNLPAYTPIGTISIAGISVTSPARAYVTTGASDNTHLSAGSNNGGDIGTFASTVSGTATFSGSAQGGASTPINIMNPMTYVNVMVKV